MNRLSIAVVGFAGIIAGCSSSGPSGGGGASCVPGENRCFGNSLGTCGGDGATWSLAFCGPTKTCFEGSCRDVVCTPGSTRCQDEWTALTCDERGLSEQPNPCELGSKCYLAGCLPMDCVAGTMRCLFDTRLTCTGSGWVGTPCAQGQACKDDQCVQTVCVPREGICIANPNVPDAQIGLICGLNGTAWASQNPCASGEVCQEGYCFPKPISPPEPTDSGPSEVEPDAGRPDEGLSEVPPTPVDPGLEDPGPMPDEVPFVEPNWAVINGNLVTFDAFVRATYTGASETVPAMLQVALHSSRIDGVPFPDVLEKQQMLEIRFPGVAAGASGEFRCEDDQVQVWYRFGKYLQGGECKDYDYHGVSCIVRLDEFEMNAGGEVLRASGTFGPVYLEDCLPGGPPVTITDGHFNYER